MKNLLKVLYGDLTNTKKVEYFIFPLKVLYIAYSLPFLLFAFILNARSIGVFGSPENEKLGTVKLILLHISKIFWSFVFWGIIVNAVMGNYNVS